MNDVAGVELDVGRWPLGINGADGATGLDHDDKRMEPPPPMRDRMVGMVMWRRV